jgi:hypothetical protein
MKNSFFSGLLFLCLFLAGCGSKKQVSEKETEAISTEDTTVYTETDETEVANNSTDEKTDNKEDKRSLKERLNDLKMSFKKSKKSQQADYEDIPQEVLDTEYSADISKSPDLFVKAVKNKTPFPLLHKHWLAYRKATKNEQDEQFRLKAKRKIWDDLIDKKTFDVFAYNKVMIPDSSNYSGNLSEVLEINQISFTVRKRTQWVGKALEMIFDKQYDGHYIYMEVTSSVKEIYIFPERYNLTNAEFTFLDSAAKKCYEIKDEMMPLTYSTDLESAENKPRKTNYTIRLWSSKEYNSAEKLWEKNIDKLFSEVEKIDKAEDVKIKMFAFYSQRQAKLQKNAEKLAGNLAGAALRAGINKNKIHTGSRGGRYYINENGRKVYIGD